MSELLQEMPECQCDFCQGCCEHKPGWLAPDDVSPLAKLLGVTAQELFDTHLAVDWWVNCPDDIYVLSPAIVGNSTGDMFPAKPTGRCVFLKDGKCSVHAAKPLECRIAHHSNREDAGDRHEAVARLWGGEHRKTIEDLLGYEPYTPEFGILDSLGW